MDSALNWARRRQRAVTKAVLALVCLAWLQAAAVPCAMANSVATTMPPGAQHCPYCPQGDSTAPTVDHAGSCSFPHQAQLDVRAAAIFLLAVPMPFFAPMTDMAADGRQLPAAAVPDPIPIVPIALRYCRYLE